MTPAPDSDQRNAAIERVLVLVKAHRLRDSLREQPRSDEEDRERARKYVQAAINEENPYGP